MSALPDWIKVDGGPGGVGITCWRCFGYEILVVPMRVGRMLEMFNAFALAHCRCEPRTSLPVERTPYGFPAIPPPRKPCSSG